MAKRKEIENYIIKLMNGLLPGGPNERIYREWFDSLSDKQFAEEMEKAGKGRIWRITAPNAKPYRLNFERNLALGRKMFNHEFWQTLTLEDDDTGIEYDTPIRFLVLCLYYNRHEQHITDKQSMPDKPRSKDLLTGQALGPGAAISGPEGDILVSQKKLKILNEFMNSRGGDEGMFRQMESELSNTGRTSQASLKNYSTVTRSTKTFSALWRMGHLDHNLKDR